jgi:hypothetical protein
MLIVRGRERKRDIKACVCREIRPAARQDPGGGGLFEEENVYFTNIVKCRPPGNREPIPKSAPLPLSS